MYSQDLTRLITEFSKATRTLENCTKDIKNFATELPITRENLLKKELEQERFQKELNQMNISQLEEQVKKIGNVMMSKSYYQNLMDELKEYRENLNNKVNKEVGIIKEQLNHQLQLENSKLTLTAEKQIAILSQQLELSNQKLDYVCRINNLESFVKVAKVVVTKVPEPQVVDTKVPEPQVVDTKAPEQQVVNTKAPEPQVVNTKAPEQQVVNTKAPEQQVVDTKAPEPQVVNTKAPEQQVVNTKVQEQKL